MNKTQDGLSNATGFTMIMCDDKGNLLFGEDDIEKLLPCPVKLLAVPWQLFTPKKIPTAEQAEKTQSRHRSAFFI